MPHAAIGLIVTSASGYVTGTYLTAAVISGLFATAVTTLGTGALLLSGAAATIVGGAGTFGLTIGATGVPVAVDGAALGCGVGSHRLLKLRKKIKATPMGQAAQFIEKKRRRLSRTASDDSERMIAPMKKPNWSAHAYTEQQIAVSRRLMPAGGLRRYAS